MIDMRYGIRGMVCENCARLVGDELRHLSGVAAVSVDVETGVVTVSSNRTLATAEVRAAVEEAGYELAETESKKTAG